MSLACTEDDLKQLLSDVAFTRNFGFELRAIAEGQCSIDVPFQDAFERPGGIVSGQVYMAAADVAMWLAIKTKLGLDDASAAGEMKTNFLGGGEAGGVSLLSQGAEVRPPADLRGRRVRGRRRPHADASHGDLY